MHLWRAQPAGSDLFEAACGHIDRPAPGAAVPCGPLQILGWCLFPGGTVARVDVVVDGGAPHPARLGMERGDILELTEHPDAPICGFESVIDLAQLASGRRTVTIEARAYACDGRQQQLEPVTVSIAPAPPAFLDDGRAAELRARSTSRLEPRARRHGAPLRILAFAHELPYGGASLFLFELLCRLAAKPEFECAVVSLEDGPLRSALEGCGIPVHVAESFPFRSVERYEGSQAELVAWAAAGQFDVALVNTISAFPGADVATRLGIPAVWAVHESFDLPQFWFSAYLPGTLHPYVQARAEEALSEAAAVVFESEATRRLYVPYADGERLITIPYGIELSQIDAARRRHERGEARRQLGIATDARVVLCLGNVEPRKGQAPLAQAFARVAGNHPRAELVLVGATDAPWCAPYVAALERFVNGADLAGRIRIEPVTADPYPWHVAADLLVCASDLESLPRSILEAMAFETPVLSTEIFGVGELIEDGRTGFLCAPRDVDGLAGALDRALGTEPEELQRVAVAAAARVRSRHEPAAYAARLAEILSRVAAEPSARARRSAQPPRRSSAKRPVKPRTAARNGGQRSGRGAIEA